MRLFAVFFASVIIFLCCQTNIIQKPNIILIVGADYVYTHNMDTLASKGTLFTHGYVPDSHCHPSLQTLMTGTLPVQYKKEVGKLIEQEKQEEDYKSV